MIKLSSVRGEQGGGSGELDTVQITARICLGLPHTALLSAFWSNYSCRWNESAPFCWTRDRHPNAHIPAPPPEKHHQCLPSKTCDFTSHPGELHLWPWSLIPLRLNHIRAHTWWEAQKKSSKIRGIRSTAICNFSLLAFRVLLLHSSYGLRQPSSHLLTYLHTVRVRVCVRCSQTELDVTFGFGTNVPNHSRINNRPHIGLLLHLAAQTHTETQPHVICG